MLQPQPENLVILIGCALAIFAFLRDVEANAFTNFAAQLSFPIYLSHPIFLFMGRMYDLDGIELASMGILGSILFGVTQILFIQRILGYKSG